MYKATKPGYRTRNSQSSEQIKNESDVKVQALKGQAAKASGDAKANIEASIAKMRERYDQSTAKLKTLAA